MVIEIPDEYLSYSIRPVRAGGLLVPILNGPIQNIARLGDRMQIDVVALPQRMADEGRIFVSRLLDALDGEALLDWPLGGEPRTGAGAPTVDGAVNANAVVLPVKGATPGFVFSEGLWVSVISGGRRYMHRARGGDAAADGLGKANLLVKPPLRTALLNGDTIEVAQPRIQGVLIGDAGQWSQASGSHSRPIEFSIRERK